MAYQAQNLSQLTDAVRRYLRLWPLYDQSGSVSDQGSPSGSQLDPDNLAVWQALNDGIAWVNRKVRVTPIQWTTTPISVQAAPSYVFRLYWIDFSLFIPYPLGITEVMQVTWYDGVSYWPLQEDHYYAPVKASSEWKPIPSGIKPLTYVISGLQIGLSPPVNSAGQLYITGQTAGILPLDTSQPTNTTIQNLPVPFHPVIIYKAVELLCGRNTASVESKDRGEYFAQLANDGLQDIINWRNGYRPDVTNVTQDSNRMITAAEQQRRLQAQQRGPGT